MKAVQTLTLIAFSMFALSAHAIALFCQDQEVHLWSATVIQDDTKECPSGMRISLNPVHAPCVQSQESEDIKPGNSYQVCGSYDEKNQIFVVREAMDARLR